MIENINPATDIIKNFTESNQQKNRYQKTGEDAKVESI